MTLRGGLLLTFACIRQGPESHILALVRTEPIPSFFCSFDIVGFRDIALAANI